MASRAAPTKGWLTTYPSKKDLTSGLALDTLDTQKLTYDTKYYNDLGGCRAGWRREFRTIIVLAPRLTLLLTLPDPAPEMLNGAAVLLAVAGEVAAVSATQPDVGQQVAINDLPHLERAGEDAFHRHSG
jgi:hypothetical protein